ncbi:MAG: hypothetical protein EOP62_02435 [Sphingomonadales bacterium]|nr:MAG: hypothetical protein EOP62_02435 [Sphingomonadales bacterium]
MIGRQARLQACCVAAISLLAAGCALSEPPEVIENRYRTLKDAPEGTGAGVLLLSVTTSSGSPKKSVVKLTELSDRAQAALVAETKGKPPIELRAAQESVGEVVQASNISRKLEFSIRPEKFLRPGVRIDAVRIEIQVAPEQALDWRISGWSQAANTENTIEVGKLTDTSASKVSASAGLDIVKFLPDASISAETSRTRVREMQIKDVGVLNAAVDETGTAWLDETAGWRKDLARNVSSIDVSVAALPGNLGQTGYHSASKLWGEPQDGLAQPVLPAKVEIRWITQVVPKRRLQPICGIATFLYRERHITDVNAATFSESDDDVELRLGGGDKQIRFLLSPAPYQPLYSLALGSHRLLFTPTGAKPVQLQFASLEQASAFRTWLLRALPKGGAVSNGDIGLQDNVKLSRPLAASDLAALAIVPTFDALVRQSRAADEAGCNTPPAADDKTKADDDAETDDGPAN